MRVDGDAAVGDEARALGLADGREGPGADQRHLAAQQVGADVERDAAALADEAGLAPGAHAAHRLPARAAARTRRRATGRAPSPVRSDPGWRCTGSSSAVGSIDAVGAELRARARRSGLVSSAMTRAPMAARELRRRRARPAPGRRSRSCRRPAGPSRCSAPQAVPVPQEIAAPVSKDSSSGSGTRVRAGHFM